MIQKSYLASVALIFGFAATPNSSHACSNETPCGVSDGSYYIAMPDRNGADKVPAVVYIHGYGGSAEGVMRNASIQKSFTDQGYAVVAPVGLENDRGIRSWSFHPDWPERRDEAAFFESVRDDAIEKHGLDPDRILLTGFSIGGSMTSYVACQNPEMFAAYAPLAGSFWREHPTECEGPVKLLHTHGWVDGTVPLEGRAVRGENINDPNALVQGDVFYAMQLWRQTNGCVHSKADAYDTKGAFMRRSWTRCNPNTSLEFALFPGGHVIPNGWVDMVIDWFEDL